MKLFRVSENVPDVYPRKSRDFQLFCAVFDCIFGQLKYNIDSIRDITNTSQCNERLLPVLQTKLGFFTNEQIPGNILRMILKAFPIIVHNKGSLTGIQYAVQVYLKTIGLDADFKVTLTNKTYTIDNVYDPENSYVVDISVSGKLEDTTILNEILRYVIPAGYKLRYSYFVDGETKTEVVVKDTVNVYIPDKRASSALHYTPDDTYNYNDMVGRVDTTFTANGDIETKQPEKISDTSKNYDDITQTTTSVE